MTLLSRQPPPCHTPQTPDQLDRRRGHRDLAVCDTARSERLEAPPPATTRIPRAAIQPACVSRSLLIASAAAAAAASTTAKSARTGNHSTRNVRVSGSDNDTDSLVPRRETETVRKVRKGGDGGNKTRIVSDDTDKQYKQAEREFGIETPPSKKLSAVERRTSSPSTKASRAQKRIFINLSTTDDEKAGASSPRKKPHGDSCGEAEGQNASSPSSVSTRNECIRPLMSAQIGDTSNISADIQTPPPQSAEFPAFGLFREMPAPCLGAEGYMSTVAKELHRQVVEFTELLAFSPIEQRVRELVLYHIEDAIHAVFPNAEVKAFGSSQTRLSLPTSDIDITVRISEDDDRSAVQNYLRHLEQGIKAAGCASWVKRINGARIPILKFDELHTGIPIDISVNQTSGHEAIPFVLDMLKRHPSARPLTLLVKQILATVGLNDVSMGGMGSYAVFLIVISFLELHPLIKSGTIDPEKNLGVIFLELMEFFGRKFDYQALAIRIAGGVAFCQKSQLRFADGTPKLCIQDPLQPNNDIAKGTFQIASICHVFATVYERIVTVATSLNDPQILSARKSSGDSHFPLSGILSISPLMLARRSAVYHAFYSGHLHHAVGLPAENERMLVDGREWPLPPQRRYYTGDLNPSKGATGGHRAKAFQHFIDRDTTVGDTKTQISYNDAKTGTTVGTNSRREFLSKRRPSFPTAPSTSSFRQPQQANNYKWPPPFGIRFRGHPYPHPQRFPEPEPGHENWISNPGSVPGFSMGMFQRPSGSTSSAQNNMNGHGPGAGGGGNNGGSVLQPWGHSLARTESKGEKVWRQ